MIKAWIQLIIFTSKRIETKKPDYWVNIYQEIVQNALAADILVMAMNCIENHFHFLIYINDKQSIEKITKQLKNITVVKLKEKQLVEFDFNWEDEYVALSVSPALAEKERSLIDQQHLWHSKISLDDEIKMLLNEGEEKYHDLSTSAKLTENI